jgi:hypothetical protein
MKRLDHSMAEPLAAYVRTSRDVPRRHGGGRDLPQCGGLLCAPRVKARPAVELRSGAQPHESLRSPPGGVASGARREDPRWPVLVSDEAPRFASHSLVERVCMADLGGNRRPAMCAQRTEELVAFGSKRTALSRHRRSLSCPRTAWRSPLESAPRTRGKKGKDTRPSSCCGAENGLAIKCRPSQVARQLTDSSSPALREGCVQVRSCATPGGV